MDSVDIGSILSSLADDPSRLAGVILATLLFGAAVSRLRKKDDVGSASSSSASGGGEEANTNTKSAAVDGDGAPAEEGSKVDESSEGPNAAVLEDDGKLRNVFSVKQRPIVHGSGGGRASTDRPFESSYYFAHNKHSTGGGYTDGLRAEDYVMNGPKLLSKGGIRVDGDEPKTDPADNDGKSEECAKSKNTSTKKSKPKLTASTPITKYMWDDDGSNNIAKIHIDSLPTSSSTKTMTWEGAGILRDRVEARLIGENNEGLHVGVTSHDGRRYHLHVPKLYGEADAVKCIVKKHKLLVKITKRKVPKPCSNRRSSSDEGGAWASAAKAMGKWTGGGNDEKEEYISVAWPRLSASSAGGGGGGTADIDANLFKDMDVSKSGGDAGMPWSR